MIRQKIFILVGSPGVGKTWVSDQLKHKFQVIEQDEFKNNQTSYVLACYHASAGNRPVLANTPFGITDLLSALKHKGLKCIPIFIIEPSNVLSKRYSLREHKQIPMGHLTRQQTYFQRARALGAFNGTTDEVLKYLQDYPL